MKINFIIPGIFKTGGMRILFEYGKRLTLNGHDVVFYYPYTPYNMLNKKSDINYLMRINKEHISFFLRKKKILEDFFDYNFKIQIIPSFRNVFIRNADIIIATSWPTAFSINKLNGKKGKKYYFIQDYEIWNSDIEKVNKSYRLNLNQITISGYLKELLKNKFNKNSEVILNGIDYNVFDNKNKIFNDDINISFIDNPFEKKNTKLAIETVELVKKKYPKCNITCFGTNKYHELPEYIRFVKNPSDNEIRNIYCASDIFLFTSREEGFGLPPAEAMACKCAVVTTKVGAIPEFSEHNVSALHINPSNYDEFKESVLYLIDNKDILERISNNAYLSVRESLNWDKSIEKFIKIISK